MRRFGNRKIIKRRVFPRYSTAYSRKDRMLMRFPGLSSLIEAHDRLLSAQIDTIKNLLDKIYFYKVE